MRSFPKKHKSPYLLITLGAFFSISLVGCGMQGAPAQSNTGSGATNKTGESVTLSPFNDTSPNRSQDLENGARKEGQLTWYTTLAGPVVDAIQKDFTKKYPFVHMNIYRGDESAIESRILQEHKAGKDVVDVLEVTAGEALTLKDQNLLVPFYSPYAQKVPDEFRMDATNQQEWAVADRVGYISFGYNKNLIPAADVPKTLQDLLKPQLKGKITLVTSTTGARWIGSVLHTLGEEQGKQFIQQLANQQVKLQAVSGAALMGLIAQGQVAGSPTIFIEHEQQQEEKGAPVGWVPIGNPVANVGDTAIAAKAKDPYTAMLFVDYLLGPDGQKLLHEYNYPTPNDKQSFTAWVPESGYKSAQEYNNAYTEWKNLLNSLTQGH